MFLNGDRNQREHQLAEFIEGYEEFNDFDATTELDRGLANTANHAPCRLVGSPVERSCVPRHFGSVSNVFGPITFLSFANNSVPCRRRHCVYCEISPDLFDAVKGVVAFTFAVFAANATNTYG